MNHECLNEMVEKFVYSSRNNKEEYNYLRKSFLLLLLPKNKITEPEHYEVVVAVSYTKVQK